MTPTELKQWLASRGCVWARGVNAGQINYAMARDLTGFSVSALKKMTGGTRTVSPRIASLALALERGQRLA